MFDFDNTCIINDIGDASFAYMCGHELLRDRELLGERDDSPAYHERVFQTYYALVAAGKLEAAYTLCARVFSGYTSGEAEALALATITEEGSRLGSKMLYGIHIERGLAPRREILAVMEFLRQRGVHLWVVSASPEPAVRAAMRHFGVEAHLVGIRSDMRDGVFTQELLEPLSMFEGKVACIRALIDPVRLPLLVAGDTVSDLPMLETADIKVVVDRGNELARIARDRGWFVV